MQKLLMSVAFTALVGSAVPTDAGSTLAIRGDGNFWNLTMITAAGALGNAAAASAANGLNASVGSAVGVATLVGNISAGIGLNTLVESGVAVAAPAGGLGAGISTSIGRSTGQSGAVAGPGWAAISGAFSKSGGVGVGGGFTNVLP